MQVFNSFQEMAAGQQGAQGMMSVFNAAQYGNRDLESVFELFQRMGQVSGMLGNVGEEFGDTQATEMSAQLDAFQDQVFAFYKQMVPSNQRDGGYMN